MRRTAKQVVEGGEREKRLGVTRIQFITSEAAAGTQPTIHTETDVQNVQQFAQMQFAQWSQCVAGTPPLAKWLLCKLQFAPIVHTVHIVRCAMQALEAVHNCSGGA